MNIYEAIFKWSKDFQKHGFSALAKKACRCTSKIQHPTLHPIWIIDEKYVPVCDVCICHTWIRSDVISGSDIQFSQICILERTVYLYNHRFVCERDTGVELGLLVKKWTTVGIWKWHWLKFYVINSCIIF